MLPLRLPEFDLIHRLTMRFGTVPNRNTIGIGDDCAVFHPRPTDAQLLTTDLLVEGIHFNPRDMSYRSIGYKAMVANLSDIAAMGGIPMYVLVSLAIPRTMTFKHVESLYHGLMQPAKEFNVSLLGGDTSESPRGLFVSLTVSGRVQRGQAIQRTGLRVGDAIFVTGTLGDACAGLELLTSKRRHAIGRQTTDYLINRHLHPTPRLAEGQRLATARLATAMIDLSDGLSGDLRHLCERNSVGAVVQLHDLPISQALRDFARSAKRDPYAIALQGGEDYELLFTVTPRLVPRINRWASSGIINATAIGRITDRRQRLRMITSDGKTTALPHVSYQHFIASPARSSSLHTPRKHGPLKTP